MFKYLMLVFVLVGAAFLVTQNPAVAEKSLAQCLSEKGVVMYGVDTCEHCQEQKELFGKDFANVNYVNCDFNEEMCQKRGITFYPVWSLGNSVRVGTQSLKALAEFGQCEV